MPARDVSDRLPLIVKVARLYHEQNLRQPEIAALLNMSQSRISRLLKEAVEVGVVRTIVVEPPGAQSGLEQELRASFGLRDAVVAGVESDASERDILAAIGGVGARYLESMMI